MDLLQNKTDFMPVKELLRQPYLSLSEAILFQSEKIGAAV